MLISSRILPLEGTPSRRARLVNNSRTLGASFTAALLGVGLQAPSAWGQENDVQQCATAYEQAQVLRNAGSLTKAQEQLRICVREVCPDFVKVDCGQWLSDVKREVPSVVFVAEDNVGKELLDVRVTIDGVVALQALDGRALELDPGQHEIVFEQAATGLSQRLKLIVRQGEKNRVVKADFQATRDTDRDGVLDASDACPAQAGEAGNRGCPAVNAGPSAPVDKGVDARVVGAIAAWSVGAVGVAGFIGWGLKGREIGEAGRDACASDGTCSERTLASWRKSESNYIVPANISVAVGGVGAATGLVLMLWSQLDPAQPASGAAQQAGSWVHGLRLSGGPVPHGASLTLDGHF
jgi:hypothetical protein